MCKKEYEIFYHKLFFHLVGVALLNSYNMMLTQSGKKPTSLRTFTYSLAYQPLQKYGQPKSKHPGRQPLQHRDTLDRLACAPWAQRHALHPIPPTRSDATMNRTKEQRACYQWKTSLAHLHVLQPQSLQQLIYCLQLYATRQWAFPSPFSPVCIPSLPVRQ
ncbi:hypothetical protein Pcinc_034018 [Petrolisthes cinctipes]|uniref:Uncharacterized protein n=1 Tax=Petrolisthes cinctipes TaxID=88211 RepID=A0AAE1JY54_PETCI|nr:hypothetical protein Pcinc_034018 [Petrolisthes cinctipes]